eukprot:3939816-Rhodomonas_salina.5
MMCRGVLQDALDALFAFAYADPRDKTWHHDCKQLSRVQEARRAIPIVRRSCRLWHPAGHGPVAFPTSITSCQHLRHSQNTPQPLSTGICTNSSRAEMSVLVAVWRLA